ncbi:hypothetical protein DFP73DRAFT_621009, partial [Morchella snyderi]
PLSNTVQSLHAISNIYKYLTAHTYHITTPIPTADMFIVAIVALIIICILGLPAFVNSEAPPLPRARRLFIQEIEQEVEEENADNDGFGQEMRVLVHDQIAGLIAEEEAETREAERDDTPTAAELENNRLIAARRREMNDRRSQAIRHRMEMERLNQAPNHDYLAGLFREFNELQRLNELQRPDEHQYFHRPPTLRIGQRGRIHWPPSIRIGQRGHGPLPPAPRNRAPAPRERAPVPGDAAPAPRDAVVLPLHIDLPVNIWRVRAAEMEQDARMRPQGRARGRARGLVWSRP